MQFRSLKRQILAHVGTTATRQSIYSPNLMDVVAVFFLGCKIAIAHWAPAIQTAIGLKQELKVGTDSLPAATAKKSSSDSDLELIARAKEGDQEAFAALFNAHKRRVYSLCLQMTGDVADAEDLTQDAFIQVFRKLATFRGASAFSTWLYRVAVNTALMKLRRRRPQQVSLDEPVCLESSFVQREYSRSDPHLQGTVDRVALVRAIKKLPDGYRTIFILHDIEGHDHREIAQLLHCSIGNSKSQLHKARLKIRELLLTAKSESLAKPPSRKPRVNRAGLATNGDSPSPSSWSAHSITAPKGYAEALLNSWTATGMWGELLHGQRGRVL